jgi:4-hydroxyphenylpyruvate dioxygenase-like putative hemolysin
MDSRVVQNENGTVTITKVEPLEGRCPSQVEDFLTYNRGPGVQHIAFLCGDVLRVTHLIKEMGLEFLDAPAEYYASLLD